MSTQTFPYFTFDGVKSLDKGLYIKSTNTLDSAARDVTRVSVPGRSGDLILDNGRYKNFPLRYECSLLDTTSAKFGQLAGALRDWLTRRYGYYELTDSYRKGYIRLASFKEGVAIDKQLDMLGEVTLEFDCKPFLYMTSGLETQTFLAPSTSPLNPMTIQNPSNYRSKPIIKVYGSGAVTFTLNTSVFYLTVNGALTIDSELMEVYEGTSTPANSKMVAPSYPELRTGPNFFYVGGTGTVTSIEITPRWCTL